MFGYVQDAGLWKPLRRRGTGLVPMMIVSIGLALAVRYVIQFYFGGATQQLPFAQSAEIQIGPVSISPNNLWSLIISAVVIAALGVVLLKTRLGKATRAVADNPALAAASGIDVDVVIRIVWVAGGMLASLGGILWAYYRPGVTFDMGSQILLLMLTNVGSDSPAVREEIFGPVVAALTFADEDEAVAMANNTEYGLAGAVWTLDVRRAMRVAQRIRAGTIWINAYRVVAPNVPFGGFGERDRARERARRAARVHGDALDLDRDLGRDPRPVHARLARACAIDEDAVERGAQARRRARRSAPRPSPRVETSRRGGYGTSRRVAATGASSRSPLTPMPPPSTTSSTSTTAAIAAM